VDRAVWQRVMNMRGQNIFLLFMCLVGIAFLLGLLWNLRRAYATRSWPKVVGEIKSCSLKSYVGGHKKPRTYEVVVAYTYKVGEVVHNGSTIALGYSRSNSYASHEMILKHLQTAKSVFVKYSPLDPNISVLSSHTPRSIKMFLGFVILFLLFCAFVGWNSWAYQDSDLEFVNSIEIAERVLSNISVD
jgi:Protein of unknown function (DUF3592)